MYVLGTSYCGESLAFTLLRLVPATPETVSVCFHFSDSCAVTVLLRAADSTFLFFSSSSHKHCASSRRRLTKCQEWRSKLEWNVSSESHVQSFPRTRVHCKNAYSASTDIPETDNISDNHMMQVTQHTWDDKIVQSHP